jgi:hypothetical protein
MVDALTRQPSLSSWPWIRWYPQRRFSVASRSISTAISALTGGRPVRCGQVQEPDQRGEDRTVGPVQPGPGIGAAQHGDLVPQHQQLCILGGR